MTQRQSINPDEPSAEAASLLARAMAELTRGLAKEAGLAEARDELVTTRHAVETAVRRLQEHLDDAKEREGLLGQQLGSLAASLDRLVAHLEGLSRLMGDLLERVAEQPKTAAPAAKPEAGFPAGGEGTTLVLAGVPGFQGLMEIQKALTRMDQVAGASVERYQEGDSRILIHLRSNVTANQIADAIRDATGQAAVVEESRPELLRLKIRLIPDGNPSV